MQVLNVSKTLYAYKVFPDLVHGLFNKAASQTTSKENYDIQKQHYIVKYKYL